MRSNFLFIRILSVATMGFVLAAPSFTQGKGHGGGKGNGGGQEKHGGGDRGGQRERRGGGDDRGGNRGERRGGGNPWADQGQARREQHQRGGWENQRRDGQRGGWENQRRDDQRGQMQQWQQAQRQQREGFRQQMREQRQWQNVQRQQRVYVQPQQNWGQFRRQQNFEVKRYRDAYKAERRAESDDWKYERKQRHFEDKAFRKASREYRQYDRRYAYQRRGSWLNDLYRLRYRDYRAYEQPRYRDYRAYDQPRYRTYQSYDQPYYQPDYRVYDYSPVYTPYGGYDYGDDGYYGNQRSNWVEPLIRSVLASFFSTGSNGGYYDDYAYNQPAYGNGYAYAPRYGYGQPSYNTFGYAPTSAYYEPATYFGYDQYASDGVPYDAFQGALPFNDLQDIYSGGIAGELIQRALGTGYYQGLLEGQQARRRGWGDRYYADPYVYEQAIYDPYSSSIGENRRYFSEGYEMGYQDALRGRDEFEVANGGGDVDLVSLLMGSVLSLRG